MYDVYMRTTFTPAPDLEAKLKEIVRKKKMSLNAVLNDVVRAGLYGESVVAEKRDKFAVCPLDLGLNPGIDPLKLRDVLHELDLEDR
jgi:hypothetical protein